MQRLTNHMGKHWMYIAILLDFQLRCSSAAFPVVKFTVLITEDAVVISKDSSVFLLQLHRNISDKNIL